MHRISHFSTFFLLILTSSLFVACLNVESKEVKASISEASQVLEDQIVKRAVGYIEVFKLQTGRYPVSLDRITNVNVFDKADFERQILYKRLADGYRLDLIQGFKGTKQVALSYSQDYWKGTGFKESNIFK